LWHQSQRRSARISIQDEENAKDIQKAGKAVRRSLVQQVHENEDIGKNKAINYFQKLNKTKKIKSFEWMATPLAIY